MRKLAFYLGLFALAAALSAALPELVHAESAMTARVQLRNGLGEAARNFTGDASDVAALLEIARTPEIVDPNRLTDPPGAEGSPLAKRVIAGNVAKRLPDGPSVPYRKQLYVINGVEYVLPPIRDLKNESKHEIELLEGLADSAN